MTKLLNDLERTGIYQPRLGQVHELFAAQGVAGRDALNVNAALLNACGAMEKARAVFEAVSDEANGAVCVWVMMKVAADPRPPRVR